MGLTGYKWSSLNVPGTEIPLSHSGWEISISPLWGNKNLASQYESEKVVKFEQQNWLNMPQMVQFDCPRH